MSEFDPFSELYQKDLLPGFATPASTSGFAESLSVSNEFAKNPTEFRKNFYYLFQGLTLSKLAFGCYRVGLRDPEHKNAMSDALRHGVNCIDVSSNYGDGEAETLVGSVLLDGISKGTFTRESIFVVTKAGYIQGRNMELVKDRKKKGNPFFEVTEFQPDCFHCISPSFLEDQLERSRKRLGLETLDCLLLHNPEYFLSDRQNKSDKSKEAIQEYYRRIVHAFRFLESARKEGKIRMYGISSNTFPVPEEDFTHTSLSKLLKLVEEEIGDDHGFSVVQFPANWYEDGFLLNRNSNGENILDLCKKNNLLPLVNRPLNSFHPSQGLVRLSYGGDSKASEIRNRIRSELSNFFAWESEIFKRHGLPQKSQSLRSLWENSKDVISSMEAFYQNLRMYWIPALRVSLQQLQVSGGTEIGAEYAENLNKTFSLLEDWIRISSEQSLEPLLLSLKNKFYTDVPAPTTLSGMMVQQLSSILERGTVLLGMRRRDYVRDALSAFEIPLPKIPSEQWGAHGV
ncbi:hypothetical protein CH373_05905 [Leptospira perolatii]|uniref:NADP-dependent oxidoreductase domain-containing protein n=1 Tax=Leptospira perolatii TaxID=2023191 RepID=A0A2M9ZR36_9LEPT|nr:aldo/keto reductase [Leptospira perolatii]PJZ68375.1 hypothetical protein CH360_16500 [Leptospira perolatii]PJZ74429.1 hypothetical protein CH373_05905 [Leptospira perolatii]